MTYETDDKRATKFYKSLTVRQREILKYVAQGYSNKKIATEMSIKLSTVKNALILVYRKMKASEHENSRVTATLLYLTVMDKSGE